MRPSETASDVHHLSRSQFDVLRQQGEFVWAVEVHGHWYGTLRRIVAAGLAAPDHYLLLVLTSDVLPILKKFASECGHREAVRSIYVLAPEPYTLRARLSAREIDNESIQRRLNDCLTWDREAWSSYLYDLLVPGLGAVEMIAQQAINGLAT